MLTPQQKKELFGKLNSCKKDISDLKNKLNGLDGQKESWLEKKEAYSKQIRDLISDIKKSKEQRNKLTSKVKEDKKKRSDLNEEIKNKISKLKELDKTRKEVSKKLDITIQPDKIKSKIEQLETKIETEVMSFDKERAIMKKIKELKKKLVGSEEVFELIGKLDKTSEETDSTRKNAQEVHQAIQQRAKESQLKHEKVISSSKKIHEINKHEQEAFEKFMEFKRKIKEINEQLNGRLSDLSSIMAEVKKYKLEVKEEKEKKEGQILKAKEEAVQDKLKKGKKITTEDLLVFQSLNK